MIVCPRCKSEKISKNGKSENKKQRLRCIECKKEFQQESDIYFKRIKPRPNCVLCNGTNVIFYGKENNQQRYFCNPCNYAFRESRNLQLERNNFLNTECVKCKSKTIWKDGKSENGINRFKCPKCNNHFQEKYIERPKRKTHKNISKKQNLKQNIKFNNRDSLKNYINLKFPKNKQFKSFSINYLLKTIRDCCINETTEEIGWSKNKSKDTLIDIINKNINRFNGIKTRYLEKLKEKGKL